jgi:predicted nucleotidyltransferase
MTKMRKGQSRSLNNWLRVRIVAQGLTIAAVVVGSWAYGTARPGAPDLDAAAAAAMDKAALERVAFEDRLRLAEEVTRAESGLAPSASGQQAATTEFPSSSPISGSRRPWWRRWYGSTGGTDKPS